MLVERHQDRAFGLALRIVRSQVDAEDVAQEAFVRAWQALPRFRGDSTFGTWLHRIVARRALDRAVSLRDRQRREASLEDARDLADRMASVSRGPEAAVSLLSGLLQRDGLSAQSRRRLLYERGRAFRQIGGSEGRCKARRDFQAVLDVR